MEPKSELCGGEKTNEWRGVPASRREWRNRRLVFWRSAGVAVSLIQMVENFKNDFVLDNKADHAQGPSTLTFQRIDLIDSFDEPRPTFSESGALFWRELGFGLGF